MEFFFPSIVKSVCGVICRVGFAVAHDTEVQGESLSAISFHWYVFLHGGGGGGGVFGCPPNLG